MYRTLFTTCEELEHRDDIKAALEAYAQANQIHAQARADLGGIELPDDDQITQESPANVLRAYRTGQLAYYAEQRVFAVLGAVAFEIAMDAAARCLPLVDDDHDDEADS